MTVSVLVALLVVCATGAVVGFVLGVWFSCFVVRWALRGRLGDQVMRMAMVVRNRRARPAPEAAAE